MDLIRCLDIDTTNGEDIIEYSSIYELGNEEIHENIGSMLLLEPQHRDLQVPLWF